MRPQHSTAKTNKTTSNTAGEYVHKIKAKMLSPNYITMLSTKKQFLAQTKDSSLMGSPFQKSTKASIRIPSETGPNSQGHNSLRSRQDQ
jgi:hypothetical protein